MKWSFTEYRNRDTGDTLMHVMPLPKAGGYFPGMANGWIPQQVDVLDLSNDEVLLAKQNLSFWLQPDESDPGALPAFIKDTGAMAAVQLPNQSVIRRQLAVVICTNPDHSHYAVKLSKGYFGVNWSYGAQRWVLRYPCQVILENSAT